MLAKALTALVTEVVLSLAPDIWGALKGAKDAESAKVKLRGVLKANGHEAIHNAVVRAMR